MNSVHTKKLKQDGLSIDGYTSENDNFGPEHIVYPLEKSLFLTEFSILPQKTCKTPISINCSRNFPKNSLPPVCVNGCKPPILTGVK